MDRIPRTHPANAVAARAPVSDLVCDIVKDYEQQGLVDELRQALGLEARRDETAIRLVRDLVYELAGARNRDLAVDVLIYATGVAEFDVTSLRGYAARHGLPPKASANRCWRSNAGWASRRGQCSTAMRTEVEQLVGELPAAGIARATRLGLLLKPGMETDTWRGLVAHVARLVRSSTGARQTLTAWLGDALAYGEAGGRGLITECAAATGINPGTLRNAKMVCRRIPVSCRRDTLSWTHHCEVGIAFADPQEIERWLTVAESDGLSAMALRRRIRSHVASQYEQRGASPDEASVTAFQLMRELRAGDRMLDRHRAVWREWSPGAAQFALKELRTVADFLDTMRARALGPSAPKPSDFEAN